MSRVAALLWISTLLVVANLGGLQAGRLTEEDLIGLEDLTPEERVLLTQEQVGENSDDFNPLKQTGKLAGEDDVEIVESPEDLEDLVVSNKYLLMQFFAPWCTHCTALQPEFGKAATALRDEGVVLAKMDAVEHNEFASDYGVTAYPTLYFFVDGVKEPYTGGRTSDSIVTWVKKKIGPAVNIVRSAEEVLEKEIPVAVAYLESVKGNDAEELNEAAKQQDGVDFYMTDDAKLASKLGLDKKTPALVLLKKQNENVVAFDGSFERKVIGEFVSANKLPLIVPFSRDATSRIFQSGVTKQLMLFADSEEFSRIRANYEVAAKSFKGKIAFVLVNLSDKDVATPVVDFFALDSKKTTLMAFASREGSAKYLYDGDYSVESLKQFSLKFLAGDLPRYFKSQKAPAQNDGPVKIVVSSTFEGIVLDQKKDVLLAVYAPWCAHCKSLEPEYKKLGEALEDVPSMVIARMDGTKNEHQFVKIEGYPALLFFPAGNKTTAPISVQSERNAGAVLKFLKANAKVPFQVPDIPYEEEDGEEEGESDEADVKDEL